MIRTWVACLRFLSRPLPGVPNGSGTDVCVEFTLRRSPTDLELSESCPSMPVRTASNNLDARGSPTNGWGHRSKLSGWVTHPVAGGDFGFVSRPAAVARKVTAKEISRSPKAQAKMREGSCKLENNGDL